jgi:hypothetical protein
MRKRGFFLMFIALAVLVCLVVTGYKSDREPEYDGVKLSEWVKEEGLSAMGSREMAERAILQIGTNALPFLLKWIQYETPWWKKGLNRWNLMVSATDDDIRAYGSYDALIALGWKTDELLEKLTKLLNDPKRLEGARRAAMVLMNLGKDGPFSVHDQSKRERKTQDTRKSSVCGGAWSARRALKSHKLGEGEATALSRVITYRAEVRKLLTSKAQVANISFVPLGQIRRKWISSRDRFL